MEQRIKAASLGWGSFLLCGAERVGAGGGLTVTEKEVLNEEDIRRAIVRIAHEVVERNHGGERLLFIGIMTRGRPLAQRLAGHVSRLEDLEVPTGALDIGLYRDDIALRPPSLHKTDLPGDLTDTTVILVDDVLYTGRSIRAAMDALMDFGRPKQIQLAVLVDRGHRELPIRADYVGKNIPTALEEGVRVRVQEVDGADRVVIVDGSDDERRDRTKGAA